MRVEDYDEYLGSSACGPDAPRPYKQALCALYQPSGAVFLAKTPSGPQT